MRLKEAAVGWRMCREQWGNLRCASCSVWARGVQDAVIATKVW